VIRGIGQAEVAALLPVGLVRLHAHARLDPAPG
jgi:hypothetical protein